MKQMKSFFSLYGFSMPVIVATILFSFLGSAVAKAQLPSQTPPYEVINPYVPAEMEFAGEKISLRRADLHERIDRELVTFTFGHTTTLLMLKRANRYFPVIEPILKENSIPDDFKYLMVIESNVDIEAYSPAGAAGLWQFMPTTGKEFGLEVNAHVDERYHVEKATRAACKYLNQAYIKYGDWLTVAASYNAGQGRISSELEKQLVDKAVDLWLNKETSRYMFRILAAKQVFNFPRMYGFVLRARDLYPVLPTTPFKVTRRISDLAEFSRKQGTTLLLLKQANPWLRGRSLDGSESRPYILQIPEAEKWEYNPDETVPHVRGWVIN